MTDEQLWGFLGQKCDPSSEPSDDWIARAKAAILSDDLPANASSEMTSVDAARYICRLLRVLKDVVGPDAMLSRDPTAGTVCEYQLRAAFVRGIALRGRDPMGASLLFTRGMEEAELRKLVGTDEIGPGLEDSIFLTGTGRVVAEFVVAGDRDQGVQGNRIHDFHQHMITKLQRAALDGDFSEWVRNAVDRFAKNYDLTDAAIHTEVIWQHENLYEDFVAKHFSTDDGPIWLGGSPAEIELAMREDFENTEKFRAACAWAKNGSRCISCGRDLANRPIDLATLTEDACRTLVALYLMSLGDSVLLVPKPPDWNEWRGSADKTESGIAWMVDGIKGPSDDRFERIGLLIERVFAEWKVAAVDLQADFENCELDSDSRSVAEADELDRACQEELKSALQAHKIRKEVAVKLTLEQRRNIIMAHWDCTPSETRDKWLVSNWKPFLGKEGKTELANKVKVFIKRGKVKLAELAAEE